MQTGKINTCDKKPGVIPGKRERNRGFLKILAVKS